ncbi:hypothetical protein O6H91_Y449200 [Diphasiastrum complanatum]|nr:hypothetical protein O6H91_Y449200 [Diphasiastrum complanatum]
MLVRVDEAEEVVDPKPALEELAKARCIKQWFAYKEDTSGHKHCTGQYFDYWACVDKYVAKRLFEFLK